MNTHVDKIEESKRQSAPNANIQLKNSNETVFQFVDNRVTSITQKKLQEQPIQKKENNTGLSDTLKTGIENLSGHSMDDVKVHYNSSKPAQLNAHAYAQGNQIHLGSGQEKHLPHEAWHVVQQKQGRVRPTMQMKGKVAINDDVVLEKEADLMGGKALQLKKRETVRASVPVVQCIPFWKKALTGAAIVGGGIASGVGLAASVPILAAAGGASLLGGAMYAGYKGYHHIKRRNTMNRMINQIDQFAPGTNPNVGLNAAAVGRSQIALLKPPEALDTDLAGPLAERRYRIDINPNNPTGENLTDPDIIRSAMLHEQTHVANDQLYDVNAGRIHNSNIYNASNTEMRANPGIDEIIYRRVTNLMRTVTNDKQLPNNLKRYIKNRLDYIRDFANPVIEYDTVVNELLYFMTAKHIEADSKSMQEITRMASENITRKGG